MSQDPIVCNKTKVLVLRWIYWVGRALIKASPLRCLLNVLDMTRGVLRKESEELRVSRFRGVAGLPFNDATLS